MRRRILGTTVALVLLGLLSSCSLLPMDDEQQAAVQMRQIVAAVKSRDAKALKKLFSPRARENARGLDDGLAYFLSEFPLGKVTWQTEGTGMDGSSGDFKDVSELYGNYDVLSNGKKYSLFFAYISENDYHPDDVGIYALGMVPADDDGYTASGERKPFDLWAPQFEIGNTTNAATGDPGVYIPQN